MSKKNDETNLIFKIEYNILDLLEEYPDQEEKILKILDRIASNIRNGCEDIKTFSEAHQEKIRRYTDMILLYQDLIATHKVNIEDLKSEAEMRIEAILDELCRNTGKEISKIVIEEPEDIDTEDDNNIFRCCDCNINIVLE